MGCGGSKQKGSANKRAGDKQRAGGPPQPDQSGKIDDGLGFNGPTGPKQGKDEAGGPPQPLAIMAKDPYDVSDDDVPVPEHEPGDDGDAPVPVQMEQADNNDPAPAEPSNALVPY